MPVPRVAAAPLEPCGFHVGLRDLPPAAHLGAGIDVLCQQLPVAGIDQRVVLQQERGREPVFGELCRLPCDGFVEYRFGDLFAARFDIADEVDDVDDAGGLGAGLAGCGCGDASAAKCEQE